MINVSRKNQPQPASVFGKPKISKAPNSGSHPVDSIARGGDLLTALTADRGGQDLPTPEPRVKSQPDQAEKTEQDKTAQEQDRDAVQPVDHGVDQESAQDEDEPIKRRRGRPAAPGSENVKVSTYRVDETLLNQAKMKSLQTGRSVNSILVEALQEWVES